MRRPAFFELPSRVSFVTLQASSTLDIQNRARKRRKDWPVMSRTRPRKNSTTNKRIIPNMPVIRRADAGDLEAVGAIQSASPEAARWPPADYLQYECTVAICDEAVAGFLVWRSLADGEYEVLNLAVAPLFRRRGIARELLKPLLNLGDNRIYLEVRESNQAARMFYKSMGFQEVSIRKQYYESPTETAIVMKFHSC
jgi:ribosomal-protein-alanine N-acetyltransferase